MLKRLYQWLAAHQTHDPAWKATGLKFTTPRGYDEDAAVRAAKRAKRHTATGRPLPKPRPQTKPAAELYVFPKEQAK